MKKKLLFGLCCAALIAGCTKDPNEVFVPQGEQIPIQLSGSIDQVVASRVNDEGFCNGDGIGVYVVNYVGESAGTMVSEGNQADNVHYVYNESENKWSPDYPIYYYDNVTPVDIIGYYPYVSNIENVNAYSFELAKDQSTDAANGLMGGYEASDFLWGKAEKVSPTASRVNITFHHKMAGVQVELVEGSKWAENEWNSVDKQVLVANTIRKATIDLTTGTISPVGDAPTTGTVPAKNGNGWRAVVVPQSVGASVALFNITVDGIPYVFRKSEGFEYLSGKLHKFTIEVSKKEQSGLEFNLIGEDITPWESETITHDGTAREYVVINVPEASTEENVSALKAAIEASGKDYTKIKNLKITGEVNVNDFYFMRDEMTMLQGVNMKNVTIVPGRAWLYADADEIPQGAFHNKSTLTRYVFPEHITHIQAEAFSGTNLTGTLLLPEGVKYLGANCFANLPLSGSLILPESLEYIYDSAFRESQFNGELHLPRNLKYIDRYAFYDCSGFKGNLLLPDNLEYIGDAAFANCLGFTGDLTIPHKVKQINYWTFGSCYFGGKLYLHNEITSIERDAFMCNKFRGELTLPTSLLKVGNRAFYDNLFSGALVLPDNIAVIDVSAFAENPRLTGVIEIPKDVNVVRASAFAACKQLEGVILHKESLCLQSKVTR